MVIALLLYLNVFWMYFCIRAFLLSSYCMLVVFLLYSYCILIVFLVYSYGILIVLRLYSYCIIIGLHRWTSRLCILVAWAPSKAGILASSYDRLKCSQFVQSIAGLWVRKEYYAELGNPYNWRETTRKHNASRIHARCLWSSPTRSTLLEFGGFISPYFGPVIRYRVLETFCFRSVAIWGQAEIWVFAVSQCGGRGVADLAFSLLSWRARSGRSSILTSFVAAAEWPI